MSSLVCVKKEKCFTMMAEETNQSQNDVEQFKNDFQRKFKKITNPSEALEFIKQKICSIGPELETKSNILIVKDQDYSPKKKRRIEKNKLDILNQKYSILNFVLNCCIENDLILENEFNDFSFANLLDEILEHIDQIPISALQLFQKIIQSCTIMMNYPKMIDIFSRSIPNLNEDTNDDRLSSLQNDLLTTILKLTSSQNDLAQFHEWYLICTKKSTSPKSPNFDKEFETIYSEKIFELHPNHSSAIWKLFLKHFNASNYHFMKLFFMFLSHIQINDELNKNWKKLINNTVIQLKQTNDERYLFHVYYALTCLKFLLDEQFTINNEIELKLYNLSYVFPETNFEDWTNLYARFDGLPEETSIFFMKLMILNYKLIRVNCSEFSSNELLIKEFLEKITTKKHLILYEIFNFIIPELDSKHSDLAILIEFLFDNLILKQDETKQQQPIDEIQRIFYIEKNWESKCYQNVFINSFLKKLTECCFKNSNELIECWQWNQDKHYWLKYGCDIPNRNNKKHLKIINSIECMADLIQINKHDHPQTTNVVLESKSNIQEMFKMFQIFCECVPLEYISPFNQIRCIMLFSIVLIELLSSNKQEKDVENVVNVLIKINIRMWCSIRKNWLFDFVSCSRYIYTMLLYLPMNDSSRILLNRFIVALFKQNHELIVLAIEELIDMLRLNEKQIKNEHVLMMQTILLRNIRLSGKVLGHVHSIQTLHKQISGLMYSNVKNYMEKQENEQHNKIINSLFIIEAAIELFEDKIFNKNNTDHNGQIIIKDKWKKLLKKIINLFNEEDYYCYVDNNNESLKKFLKFILEQRSLLLADILPENFLFDLWQRIIVDKRTPTTNAGQNTIDDNEFKRIIHSKTQWKKIFQDQHCLQQLKIYTSDETSEMMKNIDQSRFNECWNYIDSIDSLLLPIIDSTTSDELSTMLEQCLHKCQPFHNDLVESTFFVNMLSKLAKSNNINKEKAEILNENYSNIITSMLSLLFQCNKLLCSNDRLEDLVRLKLSILHLCKLLTKQIIANDLFTNRHLFLVYNICSEVNIYHNCAKLSFYAEMFLMINEILFEIINKRPYLAINSMCSAMNILITLLASLIQTSNEQNLTNATDCEKIKLENCSKCFRQTINKLTSLDDFTPFIGHMLIHYLELSLDGHGAGCSTWILVKENLTQAVMNMINVMLIKQGKQNIELFYSQLNQRSRELFKRLLEQHNQYHRFKGYV